MLILFAMLFSLAAKVLLLLVMNNEGNAAPDLLAIVGHTAGGKTTLAAHLALRLNGEIISADSRQVYRGMDIGTGKDLGDYRVGDTDIPYHLIDIMDPGGKYSLFNFRQDFHQAYLDIRSRKKLPILCGGTGLYTEAVLKGYRLTEVPIDVEFREGISEKPDNELIEYLKSYGPMHNRTDISDRERLVRALEIARYQKDAGSGETTPVTSNPMVFGITYETETRRNRITERLTSRLGSGMVGEVEKLLETTSPEDLMYYGLEYRYLTLYCLGKITYDEMFSALNTAIHQFAKRQMTWFRGMERRGIPITWIPGELPLGEKIEMVLEKIGNRLP
jgi:tRNA dimethylallyltransferase